jgi:hypothetical protein
MRPTWPTVFDLVSSFNPEAEPSRVPKGANTGLTPSKPRNTQKSFANESRTPPAPLPPVVAGELLTESQVTFLEFLADEACQKYCTALFGEARTAGSAMLGEFRKAGESHYFGHQRGRPGRKQPGNPGKLTEDKAATKKLLKKFARRAYRGDPYRRGVVFWERTAWLLWEAYSSLMTLRHRAEKIKQQEIRRIESFAGKRANRAAYMRRYRAKRNAKGAKYFKEEAKQRWREQRAH